MKLELLILALLLSSCTAKDDNSRPVYAHDVASTARTSWDSASKPVSLIIDNAPDWLSSVGVCIMPSEATEAEAEALSDGVFSREGKSAVFLPENNHALTADTAASIAVFYPDIPSKSGHEIRLAAPFGEHLYGTETERLTDSVTTTRNIFTSHIKIQSSMSVLQLSFASDNLKDIIQKIEVSGKSLPMSGTYNIWTGEWMDVCYGGQYCAAEPDRVIRRSDLHNIYMIPMRGESVINIFPTINGIRYPLQAHLSPMAPGTMIRLNITKYNGKVEITGSWIEQRRDLSSPMQLVSQQFVEAGYYMTPDLTFTSERDSLSLAVVLETDGRHGKAVALYDEAQESRFGDTDITSNTYFETIDGLHIQGKLNPLKSENVPSEHRLVFTGKRKFDDTAAFSHTDGAETTSKLLRKHRFRDTADKTCIDMLLVVDDKPSSYIPSLGELTQLYLMFNPVDKSPPATFMDPPEGIYLTSTESDNEHIYTFDFPQGVVNGQAQKQYTKARVRLFYLF